MARLGWMLVVSLSLAVVAGPRVAEACQPDPCWTVDQFRSFGSTQATIATDGVIAFEYDRGISQFEDAQALEYIEVAVVDDMGVEIPGALEAWGSGRVAVWRPSSPLPPDTALQVTIIVDNAGIGNATTPRWADCNPDIAFDLPLVTGSTPLPEIVSDGITPISEIVYAPNEYDIDQFVCCDGAYPSVDEFDCLAGAPQWDEGHCAATTGEARLDAGFEFDALLAMDTHDDLLPIMVAEAGWTVRPGIDESSVTTWEVEPFCAHLDVWSLARGTRVSTDEVCFGEDVADQLGTTDLDPSAELEAQCVGEPYTCAVTPDGISGESWDMRDCQPWPDGASDTTGTDESGDGGDADGSGEAGSADEAGTAQTDAGTASDDDTTPDSASEGSGEGSGTGEQDGVADRGCACASAPRSDVTGALGLIVLAALRRRRAAHSATSEASGS